MTAPTKTVAVIIRASDPFRIAEALRAALGLGLRGARVEVIAEAPLPGDYPPIDRALSTLRDLGHAVAEGGAVRDLIARADAVEVWT